MAGGALTASGWLWLRAYGSWRRGAGVVHLVTLKLIAFVWQAWHLVTSALLLRGRCGTYGASPHHCVRFLFICCALPSALQSARLRSFTHNSDQLCHTQLCHTQLLDTQHCHTQTLHTKLCQPYTHTHFCHKQFCPTLLFHK